MSELDDLELPSRRPADQPATEPSTERPGPTHSGPGDGGDGGGDGGRKRFAWIAIGAVVLLALLAGAGWYFYFRTPAEPEPAPPEPSAETTARKPKPPPPPPDGDEPPEPLPPLEASDAFVREVANQLSSHPRLTSWLATDELLRKFVAAIDNIAEGESPRPHLRTAAPQTPFPAIRENDRVVVDPEGYRRYDSLVAAFIGLDPEGTVELYYRLEPLLDQAYRRLGYPDTDFDRTLQRAIVELLEVPVVEGEVELEPKVRSYEYADPRLEGLTEAQKHLLRTGPDNVRRVQAQLRALARELGIPREELPARRVLRAGEG